MICGETDPLQQAVHFRQLGAGTVIVTRGGEGVTLVNETETLRAVAYPVDAVDGTGGGDAFVSGYLYGLLKSLSPRECLAFGSAMGMSCVRAMGATTGVFRREELEDFVASHPLPVEVGG